MFRPGSNTGTSGAEIEKQARIWLQQQGLKRIAENYRCRVGEIDLIMEEKGTLVFVEVRYRKHRQYGDGIESVDWRKQKKLIRAAQHYLVTSRRYHRAPCRFDVIAATLQPGTGAGPGGTLQWRWIRDAFGN